MLMVVLIKEKLRVAGDVINKINKYMTSLDILVACVYMMVLY